MVRHLDHHRLVFWIDDDPCYHESDELEVEGHERGRCGAVARREGHECTALVAEVMGLRPCHECTRIVTRQLARAAGAPGVVVAGSGVVPAGGGERVQAVIFDTDGVVTRTATVHEEAWRALFDRFLQDRADRIGEAFAPFTGDDYRRFVDGKPRYDGVASFLASRAIDLERGSPGDPPDRDTICGLGNRKNGYVLDELARNGAAPYESTLVLVRHLRDLGIPTAAVSASENCAAVLEAAGASGLFDARVDGLDANRLGLAGKPDPALFLEAADRLGVEPAGATVVEDALAGVEAGRRGGFGTVVGVDRTGHPAALAEHGADVVVPDLSWIDIGDDGRWRVRTTAIDGGRAGSRG
jgi:alpha,alpha-trehalase